MKNFRTYQLAVLFYRSCTSLNLKGDARDQLTRAARSIVLNLAEGRARATRKDQLRFFNIAMSSARECQAVLTLENLESEKAWYELDSLAVSLYRLIRNAR